MGKFAISSCDWSRFRDELIQVSLQSPDSSDLQTIFIACTREQVRGDDTNAKLLGATLRKIALWYTQNEYFFRKTAHLLDCQMVDLHNLKTCARVMNIVDMSEISEKQDLAHVLCAVFKHYVLCSLPPTVRFETNAVLDTLESEMKLDAPEKARRSSFSIPANQEQPRRKRTSLISSHELGGFLASPPLRAGGESETSKDKLSIQLGEPERSECVKEEHESQEDSHSSKMDDEEPTDVKKIKVLGDQRRQKGRPLLQEEELNSSLLSQGSKHSATVDKVVEEKTIQKVVDMTWDNLGEIRTVIIKKFALECLTFIPNGEVQKLLSDFDEIYLYDREILQTDVDELV
jgi:hypothetical protein